MFADALKVVPKFTRPVIISVRMFDKKVACQGGNYIVLNDEGWILTVAHVFASFQKFQADTKNVAAFQRQGTKNGGGRKPDHSWIINHSFWWGRDGARVTDIKVFPAADLAIAKLDPFDPASVAVYPTIKDPSINLSPGTSLCKIGFPFHQLKASFNEATKSFEIAKGVLPLPLFPLEGMYTRNVSLGKTKDNRYDLKLLETSSPGLAGQSGGPIFDTKGTVWAIQSRTQHLPLGFSPKIVKDGKESYEHQILNVGLGVHPEVIVAFLKDNDIAFNISDY